MGNQQPQPAPITTTRSIRVAEALNRACGRPGNATVLLEAAKPDFNLRLSGTEMAFRGFHFRQLSMSEETTRIEEDKGQSFEPSLNYSHVPSASGQIYSKIVLTGREGALVLKLVIPLEYALSPLGLQHGRAACSVYLSALGDPGEFICHVWLGKKYL